MTSVLPDPSTEFGARVARRLDEEVVAWLTVVDGAGTPQPAPIWFLWDGESALIYSLTGAKRLAHRRARPRVALHLNGDGQGSDIVVLTGEIVEDPARLRWPQPRLLREVRRAHHVGMGSAEAFDAQYSVPLRFTPRRVRGY